MPSPAITEIPHSNGAPADGGVVVGLCGVCCAVLGVAFIVFQADQIRFIKVPCIFVHLKCC